MSAEIVPRFSLTSRLLVTVSALLILAGSLLVFISVQRDTEQARRDLQQALRQELTTLPHLIAETVVVGDYATLQRILDRYVQDEVIETAEFRDSLDKAVRSETRITEQRAPEWFLSVFGVQHLSGSTPIVVGDHRYGEIRVVVDSTEHANRAWERLRLQVTILLIAFGAVAGALWWVLREGLSPLRRLEAGAAGFAAGRLDAHVPVAGPPELRRLTVAFNRMATEIADMHADIAASERHFRLALDAAGMAAWHWDRQSGKLSWGENPEFLLGPRPAAGYPEFPAMVIAEDRERFVAAGQAAVLSGNDYAIEFRLCRTDGDTRWVAARGRVERDARGVASGIRGVSVDISERRRVEDELARHRQHLEELVADRTVDLTVAKDQAEAANRAKSTFLANMSHEIRTPLNAVIGLTHLLLRQSPTPAQQDKLNKISTAARHLLELLNSILDLSKIEAGRMTLEQREFALLPLLESAGTLVAERVAEKSLVYRLDAEDLPETLVGDATRLSQAVLNYLGNAVKFTDTGGVTLRVRPCGEGGGRLCLRFEVRDTGVGIAPGKLGQIFEAFEQADSSTTREYGGSGLGLAIVRHIARLMGGDAGVESTPGAGSTFWFTAWFARAEPGSAAASVRPADDVSPEGRLRAGYASHRLLLAEDDPVNREVALELLRECAGLQVDLAADGAEAVMRAAETDYDLILMDMQMPVMDGTEAAQAIRALPGYGRTPIVAMTANAFADDRQRCFDAGMNDHVAKPVDPDQLFEALLRWLPPSPHVAN